MDFNRTKKERVYYTFKFSADKLFTLVTTGNSMIQPIILREQTDPKVRASYMAYEPSTVMTLNVITPYMIVIQRKQGLQIVL